MCFKVINFERVSFPRRDSFLSSRTPFCDPALRNGKRGCTREVAKHERSVRVSCDSLVRQPRATQAIASCDSYAFFVVSNLPRASITRQLHAARLPFLKWTCSSFLKSHMHWQLSAFNPLVILIVTSSWIILLYSTQCQNPVLCEHVRSLRRNPIGNRAFSFFNWYQNNF